jgi:hypothetical protein
VLLGVNGRQMSGLEEGKVVCQSVPAVPAPGPAPTRHRWAEARLVPGEEISNEKSVSSGCQK